jgi:hypothetical protein
MVESYRPTLSRFDLATGEPEEVTALAGTVPDGVALTVEGGTVVACYRPDRIVYVDPSGAVETIAEDPQGTLLSALTNVVFVGPERERLVSANLGRWHLTLVDAGLHGLPLHHPLTWGADAHGGARPPVRHDRAAAALGSARDDAGGAARGIDR